MKNFLPILAMLTLSACSTNIGVQKFDTAFTPNKPKWEHVKDHLATGQMRLKSLEEINRVINSFPYIEDIKNYGVSDYWATPKEFFAHRGGDCEDIAIAKYALALEAGLITPDEGHLVLVSFKGDHGQDVNHFILIIGDKVLDAKSWKNNYDGKIITLQQAKDRYTFLGEVRK